MRAAAVALVIIPCSFVITEIVWNRRANLDDPVAAACSANLAQMAEAPDEPYTRDRFNHISGLVLDAQGAPVAQAEICVVAVRDLFDRLECLALGLDDCLAGSLPIEARGVTDPSGSFVLEGLAYGAKILCFRHGPCTARRDFDQLFPGCGLSYADARLAPKPVIAVHLRDADGNPAARSAVTVLPPSWEEGACQAITDEAGRVELAAAAGSMLLVRCPAEGGVHAVDLDGRSKDGDIQLEPTLDLRIAVEIEGDVSSNELHLEISRPEREGVPAVQLILPCEPGVRSLGRFPVGRYLVRATSGDRLLAAMSVIEHTEGSALPPATLSLSEAASLDIVAALPWTGDLLSADLAPLAFDPMCPRSYVTRLGSVIAHVDRATEARIQDLPAGRYLLEPGGREVVLRPGEAATLTIAQDRDASTSVFTSHPHQLLDVRGATWRSVLLSDLASEVTLFDAPPGLYEVREITSGAVWSLPKGVVHGAGRSLFFDARDLPAPGTTSVHGFVTREDGSPVPTAELYLQSLSPDYHAVRRVDADEHGFYRVDNLPPGVGCVLFARPKDDGAAMKDLVTVQVGERGTRRDLTLYAGEIRAHVASGERVVLERAGDPAPLWTTELVEGRAVIRNVPPGEYRLRAEHSTRSAMVSVTPAHRQIEIELED
jgi:hypothetical protein